MPVSSFLLPGGFKPFGYVFTGLGIVLIVIRFYYSIKPEFFNWHVFAFYSSYLETKWMHLIQNQMLEEIAGSLIISGSFMLAFTRENIENEHINMLRLKAFFISVYINTLISLLALFFIFGFGYFYFLIFNMESGILFYLVAFRIIMARTSSAH
jgi:hypothetical protein